jgi:hypothetical protein
MVQSNGMPTIVFPLPKGGEGKITSAMVWAIARSRGAALATRNVPDFEECGIA